MNIQVHCRAVSLVFVLVLVAGGAFVAPAAGAENTNNSSLTANVALNSGQGGGFGSVDCTGGIATAHDCDKDGAFDSSVLKIGYDGYARGGPAAQSYGFQDEWNVTVLDRQGGLQVTCGFDTSPSGNPCQVSTTGPR